MNWELILDFLKGKADDNFNVANWFFELVKYIIFQLLGDIITSVYEFFVNCMIDLIFKHSSVAQLKVATFDFSSVLIFSQAIAASFLVFLVTLEAFERQTSGFLGSKKENTITPIIGRAITAGALIYILPTIFMDTLLALNWNIIKGLKSIMKYDAEGMMAYYKVLVPGSITSYIVLIASIVVLVAFGVLAFHAAVRFIELIVCILFAPFVAALFVKNGEYLATWIKHTCAIVFTQSFHVLFLLMSMKILLTDAGGLNELFKNGPGIGFTKFLTFVGIIVVAIRGPKIIKEFLYSSGAGGGVISMLGVGGRMVANRFMIRKIASGGKL